MWYGKVSIITYLFSLMLIFGTFYVNQQVFHDATITNGYTYNQLQALTNGTYSFVALQADPALLFGDFYHVMLFLKDLFAGGIFAVAFGTQGGILSQGAFAYDQYFSLLVTLMWDSATVFLILYIISNRSI